MCHCPSNQSRKTRTVQATPLHGTILGQQMLTTSILEHLGFTTRKGGVHASRTIMLDELSSLFEQVPADATPADYQTAICEYNCLGKRSGRTRQLTARHLTELYGLNPANPVCAGLRYLWSRDVASRPQLALLAALARDSLLRDIAPVILAKKLGEAVPREEVEDEIDKRWPERFSPATRKSAAQNINSSLTKAGYLKGRSKKIRCQFEPATASVAFALYLAWLQGGRGELLLQHFYCKFLDVSTDRLLELAAQASSKGWMVMRRVDSVVDIDFPALAGIVSQALASTDGKPPTQQEIDHE